MGGGPETTGSGLHCSNYVPFWFPEWFVIDEKKLDLKVKPHNLISLQN